MSRLPCPLIVYFHLTAASADRATSSLLQSKVWNPEHSLSRLSVIDAKHNSIFDKGVFQGAEFTCFTQNGNLSIDGFTTFLRSWKELECISFWN